MSDSTEINIKGCKKCGKAPLVRARRYSNMIYCPGHVSVLRSRIEAAVEAWNRAQAEEMKDDQNVA